MRPAAAAVECVVAAIAVERAVAATAVEHVIAAAAVERAVAAADVVDMGRVAAAVGLVGAARGTACWCCKKVVIVVEGGRATDEAAMDPSPPRAPPASNSLAQLRAVTAEPEALEPWMGAWGFWMA